MVQWAVLLAGAILFTSAGCGDEIEEGAQLAGQRCVEGSDCAPGLICSERRCVPGAYRTSDAGRTDGGDADDTTPPREDSSSPSGCEVGTRRCVDESTVEICRDGEFVRQSCSEDGRDQECREGRCVPDEPCQDADGDMYGEFCAAGPDCDDDDPGINPGVDERCDTPIDDNCDGVVNEGCSQCCGGGCSSGEFCDSCSCTEYSSDRCESQLQPCEIRGRNNGYFCGELGSGTRRCLKSCDRSAENPTSVCTTPNSECVFGDDDRGICLNGCTLEQGCGIEGVGCLPYEGSREGICVPNNPDNEIGDSCDPDQVLGCEAGALCIEPENGSEARCVEACRPFAEPNATDCSSGKCLPISDRVGICVPDNGNTRGDRCESERTTCSEDGIACLPVGGGARSCQELCRLGNGDADCNRDRECRDVREDSSDDIGICR